MPIRLRFILFAVFFTLTINISAQEKNWDHAKAIIKIEKYILQNKSDSALLGISEIFYDTNYAYLDLLTNWCNNQNRNNKTLSKMVKRFVNVIEFRDTVLDHFIEDHTIVIENVLDSTYFHLKVLQMNFLFDIGKINKADSIFQRLNIYLDKFEKSNSLQALTSYKFELNQYLLTLAFIAKDSIEFKKIYQTNLEFEQNICSSYVKISNLKSLANYLYLKQDLETSIQVADELMKYHIEVDSNTLEYYAHILKFTDILIFKSEFNPSLELEHKIFNLLLKTYTSPYYQIQTLSLSYFVQFFHAYKPNSKYGKKILEIYKVNDLPELCHKLFTQINKEKNKIRITTDYHMISKALEKNNHLKEALNIQKQLTHNLKEKYTKDLSSSIAILKIKQEKERNKHILQLEKGKQNYYILLVLVLIVILTILFWAGKQQKKKNKLLTKKEAEKTLLLKEIHHRVKNNFQIAIGLIDLQFNKVKDTEILNMLDEWKGKIKSMIMVHQNLYKNDNLTVDLETYINQIVKDITFIYSTIYCNYQVKVDSDHQLDIDTAVNLGLILNELINNAFKYGVKENKLELTIQCKHVNNQMQMHFFDRGNGIDNIDSILKSKTFGIKLLIQLAKQLNGKIDIKNDNGAHFIIHFNKMMNKD